MKKTIKQKILDEHTEQVNYFKMLDKLIQTLPELILAHAIPNGGLRNNVVAKKLKMEGTKAGVPDIFIPMHSDLHHGLFIEMKKTIGWSISENQKFWINYLNDLGYLAIVCNGACRAYDITVDYIDGFSIAHKKYKIDRSKFNKKTGLNKQYQKIAIERGYCK